MTRSRAITLGLGAAAVLAPVIVALVLVLVLGGGSPRTSPSPRGLVESILQDDDHLIYASTATVERTLDELSALGVDRIRLTILWRAIAPDPAARAAPAGFEGARPASYPAGAWFPYDRVVELARRRGIGVQFNVTAPGPLWAMGSPASVARLAAQYRPIPAAFGAFVAALGTRYSGSFTVRGTAGARVRLPRVSDWSIWNEPNQPGWLAPQRRILGGAVVPIAPALYRSYANAAFASLVRTGHGPARDTILIGELAPEGDETVGVNRPIPPMSFLRALYCVDGRYRPLSGQAAQMLGCPASAAASGFVRANPGLFRITGLGHHPYSFFLPPQATLADPNFVPLADLSRLEGGIDAIFSAYGVARRLPMYLTEYGYETDPPNPFRGVSLRRQSLYLNQAQYLASLDPRVRSTSQFLLIDAGPDTRYRPGSIRYWGTFQTGLEFADGRHKPSFNSYRLPIFVPAPDTPPGKPMLVWAMLRAAPNATTQRADVQWRPPHGAYRTLTTVATSDPSGFLVARVSVPGRGAVRIAWTSPSGRVIHSRVVGVR